MWGRNRQSALEARVDRLAGKVVVIETMYGMITGLMLGAIPENLRDGVLRELRKSITAKAQGFDATSDAEVLRLQVEEFAQQLLDRIEGVARRV